MQVEYSETEQKLLKILSQTKRINTNEIGKKLYAGKPRPFYINNVVVARMKDLAEKVRLNREKFRLERTKRLGPHPVEYWLEK